MLLTLFLAIVFCAAITLMLLSAVAFIQDKKFFSSAPKEAQEVLLPRDHELFFGARTIGWTLMVFSFLMILGVGVVSIWDGFRSGFTFWQFFIRFVSIFTIYKLYVLCCSSFLLGIVVSSCNSVNANIPCTAWPMSCDGGDNQRCDTFLSEAKKRFPKRAFVVNVYGKLCQRVWGCCVPVARV